MISLYRVFPWLPSAKPAEPGGALYVPVHGGGRIDNPSSYSVFYAGDTAAGAVAEAFGRFAEWSPHMLQGSPALPGRVRALAEYSLSDKVNICNLDDAHQLTELALRPSDVLTRDYTRSRAWALKIYAAHKWAGVRWWSWYNADWSSFGLWDTSELDLAAVTKLSISDPAVILAARTIVRPISA